MTYKLINEIGALDSFFAIKFMQLITKPFDQWKVFDLGLIDANGKTLRKAKTSEEKKEMNVFVIVSKNIKKVLNKLPGGKSKFATYAASFFLMREYYDIPEKDMGVLIESFKEQFDIIDEDELENIVPMGNYKSLLGEDILLREDAEAIAVFEGINIFTTKNRITNENILFSSSELI